MNGVTITTTEHNIKVIGFQLDSQQRANIETVRQYFAESFYSETDEAVHLLVDLNGVSTLDSSSLSPLVHRLREITAKQGKMAICGVKAQGLREVFSLTRFDQIFTIYDDRESALAALAA